MFRYAVNGTIRVMAVGTSLAANPRETKTMTYSNPAYAAARVTLDPLIRAAISSGAASVQDDPGDSSSIETVRTSVDLWDGLTRAEGGILYIGKHWFLIYPENGEDALSDYADNAESTRLAELIHD